MKINESVLYTIAISNMTNTTMRVISNAIGLSPLQQITPADKDERNGVICIPRLLTKWRGDDAEQAWQDELRKKVGSEGIITIDVQPWSHAPGYPQGDIGGPSPVKEQLQ